jgi:hypothetical protein
LQNKLHTSCSTALDTTHNGSCQGMPDFLKSQPFTQLRLIQPHLQNKLHTFCSTALDTNAEWGLPGAAKAMQASDAQRATQWGRRWRGRVTPAIRSKSEATLHVFFLG